MSNTRVWTTIAAHSMTIGGKHTFRDWSMVPTEIPVFEPPKTKTKYVEIPGSDGVLDYTDIMLGTATYNNRTGSFAFIVLDDVSWATAYSTVLNFLHGKKLNCVLDDDPLFFYHGRFFVNSWKSNRDHSMIVIDYDVDPYKYSLSSTADLDWLWNNLFDTIIYYGTFDVAGSKARNLINPSAASITPTFTCSAAMTVTIGNSTYNLPLGTTSTPGFSLAPGNNNMTFTGNGRVLVDYSAGKQL